jgi:hypothetical protein
MRRRERELRELEELKLRPDPERIAQLEREAQQRRHRVLLLLRGYGVLAVAIAFAIYGVAHVQHRQGSDEAKTCAVQARGLPAAHHLSASMRDINVFLNVKGAKEPPKEINGEFNPVFFALKNLRQELPKYVALTGQQPATRHC